MSEQSSPKHAITLFSNGMADIQRAVTLEQTEPQTLTIDVRKDHLADLLVSLRLFGDVRLVAPPRYQRDPENRSNLSLPADDAFAAMLRELSGSAIELQAATEPLVGTLLGLDEEDLHNDGARKRVRSVVVLTDDGVRRIPLGELESFRFSDSAVREEVTELLAARRKSLRTETVPVDVELVPSGDPPANAFLRYVVPCPAWKLSYRLDVREGAATLEGHAVVDNGTGEDWTDYRLRVVTGDPITFATDLAEANIPRRSFVKIVREEAFDASEPEVAYAAAAPEVMRMSGELLQKRQSRPFAGEDAMMDMDVDREADFPVAAEREVGDFCVFEAPDPITVQADGSAVVPLFRRELSNSREVLHYDPNYHATRPTRSFELNNDSDQSLPRGACTVHVDRTYAGHCVVPLTRAKETVILPHAVDTRVQVNRSQVRRTDRLIAAQLKAGSLTIQTRREVVTRYRLSATGGETQTLLIDAQAELSDGPLSEFIAAITQAASRTTIENEQRLPQGYRVEVELSSQATATLTVTERCMETTLHRLFGPDTDRLRERKLTHALSQFHVGDTEALPEGWQRIAEQAAVLDEAKYAVSQADSAIENLEKGMEEIRKNLKAVRSENRIATWEQRLSDADEEIRELREQTIPALKQTVSEEQVKLKEIIAAHAFEWEAVSEPKGAE